MNGSKESAESLWGLPYKCFYDFLWTKNSLWLLKVDSVIQLMLLMSVNIIEWKIQQNIQQLW